MNAPLGLVDRAAARARYDAALIEQATAVEIAAWKAAAWLRDYRFLVERYSPDPRACARHANQRTAQSRAT